MFVEEAVKACYQAATAPRFVYHLSADFPAFKGHFEGRPLLPAVCQISFCVDAAGRLLGQSVEVVGVKRAKFINPALPGTSLEVCLTTRPDGWYFAELTDPDKGTKLSQLILQFAQRKL
jgi:3-hydroxymyristoyl/3-hydroxydecanoyl-(acyl carrier protein) dehydratase